MTRWEPDANDRLVRAALELFIERGFDETTVSEIAARAGLTERTFFRYFTDKREVLFAGSQMFEQALIANLAAISKRQKPLETILAVYEATGPMFEERREFARKRMALIAAHEELHERELIKLAKVAAKLAAALRHRGVPAQAATLAAEVGTSIFKLAFETWVNDARKQPLGAHMRKARDGLKKLAAS